jgi:prepilin-type N-terminal cleavage/methylation domain-containing protein
MKKLMKTGRCDSGRSAFTLVELLLVIAIIGILASLGLGIMAQAQEDAALAATRSRITLIEKILETELEEYEVRRSPVSVGTIAAMVNSSGLESNRMLLHIRNIKRMLIADLIRSEMPDGTDTGGMVIGEFPTMALQQYFSGQLNINVANFGLAQSNRPYSVRSWETWRDNHPGRTTDTDGTDNIFEDAAYRSELLFAVLSQIDIDGVPATETIGSNAIGDTDGNGFNEILDGWGRPMFLQWQQVIMTGDPEEGIWEEASEITSPEGRIMCGLSCEHFNPSTGITLSDYVTPVLPTQIRPYLTSERLVEVDGYPTDVNHRAFGIDEVPNN